MKYLFLVLVLLLFCKCSTAAKILFVAPVIAKSHQKVYFDVLKSLSLTGRHDIHFVGPILPEQENIQRFQFYFVGDLEKDLTLEQNITRKKYYLEFLKKPTFMSMFKRQYILHRGSHDLHARVIQHEKVQKLLKMHKKFDLCIVEWFYPTLAVFGHYFQCPVIGISSTGMLLSSLDAVGNPSHPVLAPDQDLPLSRKMDFFERVWSGIWAVYIRLFYQFVTLPEEQKTIRKFFGDDVPPLSEMVANISLLLVNTNIIFHRTVPNLPTVVQFGGLNKNELPLTPLSKDLEEYISNSKHGVVYFSFGSSVQPETLSPHVFKTFQDTFASLPFNFIWKWNGTMPNKPKNVLTKPWLPQEAILGHRNVKLLIYQGGLQSTEETISAHKPVIGIPFHSDQTFNIDTCVKYGMGETIALEELTVNKLRNLILKVANTPSYIENVKKLDALIKDQPMAGIDKAIWWIEYVIRHKGAHHLRSPAATMPLWQYLMLDVVAFILVILYVSYKVVKFVCSIILRVALCRKKKSKTE